MVWNIIRDLFRKPAKIELAERARQKMLDNLERHVRKAAGGGLAVTRRERDVSVGTTEPYSPGNILTVEIRATSVKSGALFVPEASKKRPQDNFTIHLWRGNTPLGPSHIASEINEVKRRLTEILREHRGK